MSTIERTSTKHILSFGGGVNTVALMIVLVDEGFPLDEVVFSDTGGEAPETYDYLETVGTYLKDHCIPFRTVSKRISTRDLYETCSHRKVIPSVMWRWCTRDFKVKPIHAYYRSLNAHINQYMGIAFDEIDRMKDSRVEYVTNLYPLIDRRMTREHCVEVIEAAGLPIPVKSGCYFCPFNSKGRWEWLLKNHADLFEKSVALEEQSKHFPNQRLTDQVFRERAKITLRELGEMFLAGDTVTLKDMENPCGGECMV